MQRLLLMESDVSVRIWMELREFGICSQASACMFYQDIKKECVL